MIILGLSDDDDADDGANEPLIGELDLDGVTSQVPADLLEPSQPDKQRDSLKQPQSRLLTLPHVPLMKLSQLHNRGRERYNIYKAVFHTKSAIVTN